MQNEWIRFKENQAFVGLTGKGIEGDVVYIELPKIGQSVKRGESCATVESVKSVIDVHAPATGIVSEINDTVYDDPDIVVQFAGTEISNAPVIRNSGYYIHQFTYQLPYRISLEQGDILRRNVSFRGLIVNSTMFDSEGALASLEVEPII